MPIFTIALLRFLNDFGLIIFLLVIWLLTSSFFHELGHAFSIKYYSKDKVIIIIGDGDRVLEGRYYLKIKFLDIMIYLSKINLLKSYVGRTLCSSNYQKFSAREISTISLSGILVQVIYFYLLSIILFINENSNTWVYITLGVIVNSIQWFLSKDRKNFIKPKLFQNKYKSKCCMDISFDYKSYLEIYKANKQITIEEIDKEVHNKIKNRAIIDTVVQCFPCLIIYPIAFFYFKTLFASIGRLLWLPYTFIIVGLVLIIINIFRAVKIYKKDKISILYKLMIKIDLLKKNGFDCTEKYKLFSDLSKYERIEAKAQCVSDNGFEFIITFMIGFFTILFTIITPDKIANLKDYLGSLKSISGVLAEESLKNNNVQKELEYIINNIEMQSRQIELDLFLLVFIVYFILLIILVINYVKSFNMKRYILSYIEDIEKEL